MSGVAFIFARGGSKGLPGKNIKPFCNGPPLLARSILVAKEIAAIDSVYVSTDSEEIAEVALKYGAEVPFIRPPELASDTSPEWHSWQHAVNFLLENKSTPDWIVSLPPTAPLRNSYDVESCIKEFESNQCDVVISVTDPHRNPFFNMVKRDDQGLYTKIIDSLDIHRRQDAPSVFDITTVAYVADPNFILSATTIFDGIVRAVHVPFERSIDIDNQLDFDIAEFLFTRGMDVAK